MSVRFTNVGTNTYVSLYFAEARNLYIETNTKLTTGERINGTFTYISKTLS